MSQCLSTKHRPGWRSGEACRLVTWGLQASGGHMAPVRQGAPHTAESLSPEVTTLRWPLVQVPCLNLKLINLKILQRRAGAGHNTVLRTSHLTARRVGKHVLALSSG